MEQSLDELSVNGVVYVRKDAVKEQAEKLDGLQYCIVRTYSQVSLQVMSSQK